MQGDLLVELLSNPPLGDADVAGVRPLLGSPVSLARVARCGGGAASGSGGGGGGRDLALRSFTSVDDLREAALLTALAGHPYTAKLLSGFDANGACGRGNEREWEGVVTCGSLPLDHTPIAAAAAPPSPPP